MAINLFIISISISKVIFLKTNRNIENDLFICIELNFPQNWPKFGCHFYTISKSIRFMTGKIVVFFILNLECNSKNCCHSNTEFVNIFIFCAKNSRGKKQKSLVIVSAMRNKKCKSKCISVNCVEFFSELVKTKEIPLSTYLNGWWRCCWNSKAYRHAVNAFETISFTYSNACVYK